MSSVRTALDPLRIHAVPRPLRKRASPLDSLARFHRVSSGPTGLHFQTSRPSFRLQILTPSQSLRLPRPAPSFSLLLPFAPPTEPPMIAPFHPQGGLPSSAQLHFLHFVLLNPHPLSIVSEDNSAMSHVPKQRHA